MNGVIRRRGMVTKSEVDWELIYNGVIESDYGLITPLSYDPSTKILEVDNLNNVTQSDNYQTFKVIPTVNPIARINNTDNMRAKTIDSTHLETETKYNADYILSFKFYKQQSKSFPNIFNFRNIVLTNPGKYRHEVLNVMCWSYDTLGAEWNQVPSWASEYNSNIIIEEANIYFTVYDDGYITLDNMIFTYITPSNNQYIRRTKEYIGDGTKLKKNLINSVYICGDKSIYNFYKAK